MNAETFFKKFYSLLLKGQKKFPNQNYHYVWSLFNNFAIGTSDT